MGRHNKRLKKRAKLNIPDIPQAKPVLKIAEDIDTRSATEHAPDVTIHAERVTQQVSRGETIKPARNGGYRHSWDSPMAGYCYTVYK